MLFRLSKKMPATITHHIRKTLEKPDSPTLRSAGHALRADNLGQYETTIHHLLILWVVKGRGVFKTDGIELQVPEGSCVIISPPASYLHETLSAESETCWISYCGKNMTEYCRVNGIHTGAFAFPNAPVKQIIDFCEMLDRERIVGEDPWMQSLALMFLDNVMNNILRFAPNKQLHKAKVLTHQQLSANTFGVETLAAQMDMHRKSVYGLCKESTGVSPREYISRSRMHLICRLLRYSDLTISEIASMSGFSDTAYFSKAFKKLFGKSVDDFQQHPCCTRFACPEILCSDPAKCTATESAGGCLPKP